MENIIFVDREEELAKMKELQKNNFFLVVTGRRRIGKTSLALRGISDAVYIFVWPNKSLSWIIKETCNELKIPEFRNFKDILNYLFDLKKPVIIDEFQNFYNIDKSIYGELQKVIDERRQKNQFFQLVVAGSSYSMINKIFNQVASPLYGRRTEEIHLDHLGIVELFNWVKTDIENFIQLWAVFEGVPYYYELIDPKKNAKENILNLIVNKNAKLQEEGRAVISMEFGIDSKTYSTIITAISEGKTKLNEIAILFDKKANLVTGYLDLLRKKFKIVQRNTPILSIPKKSKEGRYEISDNFLSFWFYFIEKRRDYIEQERFDELNSLFSSDLDKFTGKIFEKFIINLLREKTLKMNIEFTKIGTQFGRIPQKFGVEKGKNVYEIDILAPNERTKEILFGECKWKDEVNAEKVASELIKKAEYVDWNNEERKEFFTIFAKSFSKKITEFNGKKVTCIDLKDIEKAIKSR